MNKRAVLLIVAAAFAVFMAGRASSHNEEKPVETPPVAKAARSVRPPAVQRKSHKVRPQPKPMRKQTARAVEPAPRPAAAPAAPTYAASIETITPAGPHCAGEPPKKRRNRVWGVLSFVPRKIASPFRKGEEDAEGTFPPAWMFSRGNADERVVRMCAGIDGGGIVREVHGLGGPPDLWAPAAEAVRAWKAVPDPRQNDDLAWVRIMVTVTREDRMPADR